MMRFAHTPLHRVGWRLSLLLFVLLLAACSGRARPAPQEEPPPAPAAETTPATPVETPAAAPDQPAAESPLAAPNQSPLAQPSSPLGTPTEVPQVETAPGTGAVTGMLLLHTEAGEVPVSGEIVALGTVLTNTEGLEVAVRYNPQTRDDAPTSPKTITDENGFFVFSDVPPGRYGIVLDIVLSSFILRKPGTTEDLFITVEPDTQLDMGPLVYDDLPLPDSTD